jgi:hypothetical protein
LRSRFLSPVRYVALGLGEIVAILSFVGSKNS